MANDFVIRVLLLPFSLMYGLIVSFRELLYKIGLIKSVRFSMPVIGVGNLSVGGTGKTPHVEYLVKWLDQFIQVAILSRGYGRKTVGVHEVHVGHTAEAVGDEPLQIKRKFPQTPVFVAENRSLGIPGIVQRYSNTQAVILDDAFQHRAVQPGIHILLTEFDRPYTRDWLLPAGRLREWRSGADRADIIIVTKCPAALTEADRQTFLAELEPRKHQKVYFSTFQHGQPYLLWNAQQRINLDKNLDVLLVSALAGTDFLTQALSEQVRTIRSVAFKDHHAFTLDDLETIKRDYGYLESQRKVMICTEKDAVKLERFAQAFIDSGILVFVLPAEVQFLQQDEALFQAEIKQFLLDFKA